MGENNYLINSVLRAAQILESYSLKKSTYTNSELARKLGLNKSTVTRLLYSLEKAGFLERDAKTKEYRLTYRLYNIGNVYIRQIDLHNEALPLLKQLVAEVREAAHLAVLIDFKVFCLDQVQGPQSYIMKASPGETVPAHATGLGKAMIANLNGDDLETFFRSVKLERYTPNTICNVKDLRLELERVRERGYAIDDFEFDPDMKCVGAPVRDRSGEVIAATSLTGPSFRMTRERIEEILIPAITNTASKLSSQLGYVVDPVR